MSPVRSVTYVSGPDPGFMERAMGIEPTSEVWEKSRATLPAQQDWERHRLSGPVSRWTPAAEQRIQPASLLQGGFPLSRLCAPEGTLMPNRERLL